MILRCVWIRAWISAIFDSFVSPMVATVHAFARAGKTSDGLVCEQDGEQKG